MIKDQHNVLGIMSGSSLDGIDLALCSFSNFQPDLNWELIHATTIEIPQNLKDALSKGVNHSAKSLLETEVLFTEVLAKIINEFLAGKTLTVDAIASHGHTLYHRPKQNISLQIGNGGLLSALTNTKVIADFRIQDVALGGEGTPLAAISDRELYQGHKYYLNLGGIANLSINESDNWSAYDICPCNQVLDFLANKLGHSYDDKGSIASSGKVIPQLYQRWTTEEYFYAGIPKSLDNNWIKDYWLSRVYKERNELNDTMHSYVQFITDMVDKDIQIQSEEQTIFVTGGGAKNKFLVSTLRQKLGLKNVKVMLPNEDTIDYKEATLMAYIGYLRLHEKINIIKSVTGASRSVSGGAVYLAPIDE